jgi:hypothetical protein
MLGKTSKEEKALERMRKSIADRMEMRDRIEKMSIEEYLDFVKRADERTLGIIRSCGVKGARYWIAEHQLCHKILGKLVE